MQLRIFCTRGTNTHHLPQVGENISHNKDDVHINFQGFAYFLKALFGIRCWRRLKNLRIPFPFGNYYVPDYALLSLLLPSKRGF